MIDHNVMNDRITSSELTLRASNFRRNVMARDGRVCVFTGEDETGCDAAPNRQKQGPGGMYLVS